MKVKNTSKFDTTFVRRMLAWCRREVDCPPGVPREAWFRDRKTAHYSGHAYGSRRIVASVNIDASRYPVKSSGYKRAGRDQITGEIPMLNDPHEALVMITAHELAHVSEYRRTGAYARGAEDRADARARFVLRRFRDRKVELLAAWAAAAVAETLAVQADQPKPNADAIAKRAEKASRMLVKWERKMKLARTKIAAYRRKVNYYERRAATSSAARPATDD
jgi:hypothetical protein